MAKNVHVSHDQLVADIKAGTIDTVLAVFADHAGRLIGKRTDGEFYLDVVHEEGTENCDYLIACDLDNTPIPGFRWASYDQGYGDMRGVVDEATVRYLPWIEKTAMVIVDLDHLMGGLQASDLVIIAGRPGMGKTALATNIAYNIAAEYRGRPRPDGSIETVSGGIVGFFSLEMSAEQLATRILSEQTEIPSSRVRRGDISEFDFAKLAAAARP